MLRIHHSWIASLVLGAVCLAPAPSAAAEPFGITTGEPRGTYFAFGQDIGELAETEGIALRTLPSQGSLENIHRVFQAPEAQLGIVQHDVLVWVRTHEGSEIAQRMAERIKLVFPLYDEEVHVIARGDAEIDRFADLDGKIVAVGPAGSGTSVTAGVLFQLTGVAPAERIELPAAEALLELKRGALDAVIYVAGAPVKLLVDDVQPGDDLRLVPIEHPAVREIYGPPVALDASHYPWAKDGVRTVGVKAVLVTYDYQINREKCAYVGEIAQLVRREIGTLRRSGHPKWQDVDLDAEVVGWDTAPCTQAGAAGVPDPADPTFQRFLEQMTRARG